MGTRLPKLDERLAAVADFVPQCQVVADIGADHGHVPCVLLREGRCQRMVVSDVSPKALARAQNKLALHGVADQADFRVADGLDALDGPVDVILIAGMGAQTICEILTKGLDRLGGAILILQANREPEILRAWMREAGYRLTGEKLVRAAGRMYVVLQAAPGQMSAGERELFLGPLFLEEPPARWKAYLHWRLGVLQEEEKTALNLGGEALAQHQQRKQWIEEALQ